MNILFIFPRRGLFQITRCHDCGYIFECEHCSNKLTAYRSEHVGYKLQLLCNQCQTSYSYPNSCAKCGSKNVLSKYGGIDDLVEQLTTLKKTSNEVYGTQVAFYRLDKNEAFTPTPQTQSPKIKDTYTSFDIQIQERTEAKSITSSHIINELFFNEDLKEINSGFITRLYDPSVDYSVFDQIVYVQAENLLAAPDWLVTEDVYKSLFEILLQTSYKDISTKIIFDTNAPHLDLFNDLTRLNSLHENHISLRGWYEDFIKRESKNREKFSYPPFTNIILMTTQSKTETQSKELLTEITRYLNSIGSQMPEISWSSIYPAKFLRRKGMYSHHLVIRYPRQYPKFFQLRSEITKLADLYRIQVRLNPRHLF